MNTTRRSAVTLIELLVAMAIIGIVIALLVVAIQKVRSTVAQAQCANKLKQIALGLHNYHAHQRSIPPALNMNIGESWYLSWMGRILPYLDQDPLAMEATQEYQRVYSPWGYFWKPAWGGQGPHAAFGKSLDIYRCSVEGRPMVANLTLGTGNSADAGFTSYLGVSGTDGASQDGMLIVGGNVQLTNIPDGSSNTLMIGERPPYTEWWYGMWYAGAGYDGRGTGDVILGSREVGFAANLGCPPTKTGLQPGRIEIACDQVHFWSWHSGGSNFAFADGTVRFVAHSSDNVLPALATRNGGEAVPD